MTGTLAQPLSTGYVVFRTPITSIFAPAPAPRESSRHSSRVDPAVQSEHNHSLVKAHAYPISEHRDGSCLNMTFFERGGPSLRPLIPLLCVSVFRASSQPIKSLLWLPSLSSVARVKRVAQRWWLTMPNTDRRLGWMISSCVWRGRSYWNRGKLLFAWLLHLLIPRCSQTKSRLQGKAVAERN